MPQLIKNVQVITKDGELSVALTLDINVNINNSTVSVASVQSEPVVEDKTHWEIPTFAPSTKLKFGKKE